MRWFVVLRRTNGEEAIHMKNYCVSMMPASAAVTNVAAGRQ
jgi:hypothetical protein